MQLTPEQVWFFRHNGFVLFPEPLPPELVERLKARIWQDIDGVVEPTVRDSQGRIVRISKLWERGEPFREAITHPHVLEPLESLVGPHIEMALNRHNHATLRLAGDGTSYFHRDNLQWSRALVTVLFYLEATNLENGCTRVVPGTQLLPAVAAPSLDRHEPTRASGLLEQAVPVPMPAGGLLAIDSLILHAAGPNHTAGTRMSMTIGFHSVDEFAGAPDPKRVLVRGERIYQGNDRY